MKRIVILKGQIMVHLVFLNQLDKELKLGGEGGNNENLTDEKGNIFEYIKGIEFTSGKYGFERAQTLLPKSNNDVVLYFKFKDRDINIKEIGSNFIFSLRYKLYNPSDRSLSYYDISFTDIKAQRN